MLRSGADRAARRLRTIDALAGALEQAGLAGDADAAARRRHVPPADRRAAPVRLALHAALAHRADRADDAAADPRAARRARRRRSRSSTSRSATRRWAPARSWSRPAASSASAGRGAGTHHRSRRQIPPDEDELLHARRLVAQRCLYGVDKNPLAVDLAKLSLWLATLAKEHPFTFLDHALRQATRSSACRASRSPAPLGAREAAAAAAPARRRARGRGHGAAVAHRGDGRLGRHYRKRKGCCARPMPRSTTCGSSATWSSRRSSAGEAEGAGERSACECRGHRAVAEGTDATDRCRGARRITARS